MNLRIDSFSPTTNARENSRKRKWKVAVGSINILRGHGPRVLFSFQLVLRVPFSKMTSHFLKFRCIFLISEAVRAREPRDGSLRF